VMRGVKELRVKESDRIDAMARGLEACGVRIEEDEDTLIVHGMGPGGVPGGRSEEHTSELAGLPRKPRSGWMMARRSRPRSRCSRG